MQKDIRWGILGAGNIAHAFVNDFKWMSRAQLLAVAASDTGRASDFAKQYGIPQGLSYDELYKRTDIDAVYIATTHHLHFEQAMQCLLAGKAVLCEKPITINDAQCKELIDVSRKKKVLLMEAMWTYFLPAFIKAKQWVDEGHIGKVKVIQADFAYPMDPVTQPRLFDPSLAGGSLLELGIYPIAFAYYFIGRDPEKIISSAQLSRSGVDEQFSIAMQYGDLTASLFSSMVTRMGNTGKIFGDKGYIEIPDFWRCSECKLYDSEFKLAVSFQDIRVSHGFIYEMQHANDLILAGEYESPIIPHSRSHALQKIMSSVRKESGVKFSEKDYPG